jgi:asparagine synthase (glutamine-hydrolysing)
MPGIVGLFTRRPRPWAERQLLRMVEALHHEPFYVTGTWVDPSLGAYVGWVARKDSFSDGMPLTNERGDVVLVFSGEDFPEPGAARRLKERGHEPEPEGGSYLVHLYEDDGAFPAGLNGRFHGVVADRSRGITMLFNDRYGVHRIYYHEAADAFYFAAEAKAILDVKPELRQADPRALGELVACGCVLENRTLFPAIHVLPGAAVWLARQGMIERKASYFHPREWEEQPPLSPASYHGEIRDVFARNLPRYFEGREPIGMSLTGGLDSRMIMAWHKAPPGSLPCYTVGGMFRDSRDVVVARRVARLCEQPHDVIRVGEQFLSRVPYYAERAVYLTDGCVDVTHSPDLYLNEQARAIAPVRMTGNYGGEVLRQVRAFKPQPPAPGLFQPALAPLIQDAAKTYADLLDGHPLSFAVFRQAPWHHYGLLALEQTQLSLRSPYLDNDLVRTVFRAPVAARTSDDLCRRLIVEGDAALGQLPTDRGAAGDGGRLAAAASHAFWEFLFKAEYAYDSGMPQWAARLDHRLSFVHLERLFLGRHRFHHFRIWYRDALAGYIREMLLDRRTLARPYLQRRRLEAMVAGHLRGEANYTIEIGKVLTLELIHRVLLDPR